MANRVALFSQVLAALDACGKGWTLTLTDHYRCIRYNGRTYPSFPRGPHQNPAKDYEVFAGKVRQLFRQLELDNDCARALLPDVGL